MEHDKTVSILALRTCTLRTIRKLRPLCCVEPVPNSGPVGLPGIDRGWIVSTPSVILHGRQSDL